MGVFQEELSMFYVYLICHEIGMLLMWILGLGMGKRYSAILSCFSCHFIDIILISKCSLNLYSHAAYQT